MGLRERNKQEKLQRIQEAARALFSERGFEATTTHQIAERAGVAKGTLFLYARDKHDLLFLVLMDDLAQITSEGFERVRPGPVLEQLLSIFGALLEFYARNPALGRLFVRELLFLSGPKLDDYNALTFGFLARIAALLAEAVERNELRSDLDVLLAASHLFSVYACGLVQWLQDPAPDLDVGRAWLRRSFVLLLEGFGGRG